MAYRLRVTCVHKKKASDPRTQIVAIGGRMQDGSRWFIPQSMAVEGLERGRWAFYIEENRKQIDIVVGQAPDGSKFLRATDDDARLQRLLSLPGCTSIRMFAQTA